MSVFKTYDVRGVWGQGVDLALAYRIGRALPRHMNARTFLIGYDARVHSAELYQALAAGLLDEGVDVTGAGLVSTPLLHYTQMNLRQQAAVMVTASHNPPEYHGFKFFDSTGGSLSYDKGLSAVEKLVAGITAPAAIPSRTFPTTDGLEKYAQFVAGSASGRKLSRKIVIDASNGSSGPELRRLVQVMGQDAVLLNMEPDGTFPNHDPNPLKEKSRAQASAEVARQNAAFGVILDGDGDRILFVDEAGRSIENYFLAALVS
ncbi:MAG TPA: hypothetical protein VFI08_09580, partial [Spirochaetia bacterium]|nr:hypothetical protein [Spirochaetia bacterium]